jgi:hypothetical protein
MSKET